MTTLPTTPIVDLSAILAAAIAKLPDALKPVAAQYGPSIMNMGAESIKDFLDYMAAGDVTQAYGVYLASQPVSVLHDEWAKNLAEWKTANQANADAIALQKKAAMAVCSIILTLLLAVVGF
jgi:hypothetical protein